MPRNGDRREFLRRSAAALAGVAALGPGSPGIARSASRVPDAGHLDAALRALTTRFGVAGLGLGIASIRGDRALAYGKASLPFSVAATPHTLFQLGSVGKHFTAIAALQLASEGHFSLEEPIGRYLGDIPDDWGRRSILCLLHHLSGIPDYNGKDFDESKAHSRAEVIASAAAHPALFEEGRAWSYSNTNYILLGYLIEAASGSSFASYLTDHVLRRAGLTESRVDDAEAVVPLRAEPYLYANGEFRHALRMASDYSGYADGPLLMSAVDAVRWDHALQRNAVLGADQFEVTLTPGTLRSGLEVPYGCGWFTDVTRGRAFHSHTGGVPGFTSFYLRMPLAGISVMVMTNVRLDSARVQRNIGYLVAESLVPGATMLSLPVPDDDRPELTRAARSMLTRGGQPLARGILAPEILALLDGPIGEHAVSNWGPAGEPTSFAFVEQRRLGPGVIRRYRLTYADLVDHVSVGYTPEGLVYWVFPD